MKLHTRKAKEQRKKYPVLFLFRVIALGAVVLRGAAWRNAGY